MQLRRGAEVTYRRFRRRLLSLVLRQRGVVGMLRWGAASSCSSCSVQEMPSRFCYICCRRASATSATVRDCRRAAAAGSGVRLLLLLRRAASCDGNRRHRLPLDGYSSC
ncbi:hypothetical protein PIB30_117503 [Stylosanthes scabra]|uniref:Uncharacterized protein n=1 Tax=Stylosanthes scabra TaxID=79078 RepID=A0ABU6UEN3_9FABA|nr:hypothetical protein [Stylosanthes scabra]